MRWVLPEFIEDILPDEAARIESLRRMILDVFAGHGYDLVMPPMLEYVESLLSGTGHDLDLRTFKLVDQLSGRMMGVRADITPQVARLDAHLLNRRGVTRLCYCGSVLHARPAALGASREMLQIGAEIYGHAGIESDLEIQRLLSHALARSAVREARLDIGHVAVFGAIVRDAGAAKEHEGELFEALQRKDVPALRELTRGLPARTRNALLLLPELYGGPEVLRVASRRLPKLRPIGQALHTLRVLVQAATLPVGIDLAELRGYHYHSGVVFDAYCAGVRGAVARGGRYDEVGSAFGRSRPATGFSIDLRSLATAAAASPVRERILAPLAGADRSLARRIAQLRASGCVVIEELPGHSRHRGELGCTHELVRDGARWRVVKIGDR